MHGFRRSLSRCTAVIACVIIVAASACQSHRGTNHSSVRPPGMQELAALVEETPRTEYATIARPRSKSEALFHEIEAKAREFLDEIETWDNDVRLTSETSSENDSIRLAVLEFRRALQDLCDAADASDTRAVRTAYETASSTYQHLLALAGVSTDAP